MPRVSVRWKIRKNRTVGASPSSEAAAVVVGSDVYWLFSVPIATETVWLSLAISSTSGNRNSFHVQMKKKVARCDYLALYDHRIKFLKAVEAKFSTW